MRILRVTVIVVAALIVVADISLVRFGHLPLIDNATPSMPRGLYWATYGQPVLARGDVVLVCLSPEVAETARSRGYVAAGTCPGGSEVLLKRIAAVAGDSVVVGADGLAVNGRSISNTMALNLDSSGRPMNIMASGLYLVPPGFVWVVATHDPRSFDSRYFGPLPVYSLIGAAYPLLTE